MGIVEGVPYTVAEDEKTKLEQLYLSIAYMSALSSTPVYEIPCRYRCEVLVTGKRGLSTHIQKSHTTSHIHLIILQRHLPTLSDRLQRRQMHYSPNTPLAGVLFKDRIDRFGIPEVGLMEDGLRRVGSGALVAALSS